MTRRNVLLLFVLFVCALHSPGSALAGTYWVSTHGNDSNAGTKAAPFQTINKAASIAKAGDTVIVRPGVYRERVMPLHGGVEGSPIVYRSEVKHQAAIKGSDLWQPNWKEISEGIFAASPDPDLFTDHQYLDGGNPYAVEYRWKRIAKHLLKGDHRPPHPHASVSWTLGQVFVDGKQWKEVSSMEELSAERGTWFYHRQSDEIRVHLGNVCPNAASIEITTRRGVFRPARPGLGHIHVIGFVIEHCGNQFPYRFYDANLPENAQSGMVGTRGGHHWVIRDNIIRYAKSIGIDMGGLKYDNEVHSYSLDNCEHSSHHQIIGNVIYANGSTGIMGARHHDVVIRDNIIAENNYYKNTEYEHSGIKTHGATRLLIEGNWFLNNETMGVWLDNSWKACRVTRNVFLGNRGHAIFLELDNNTFANPTVVDHNIILSGRGELVPRPGFEGQTSQPWAPWDCGIYTHDADGLIIVHNLLARGGYGIYSRESSPRRGSASYRKIFGNIFAGDKLTSICYPVDYEDLVKENHINHNIYPARSDSFVLHALVSPGGFLPAALERIGERWRQNHCPGEFGKLTTWGPPNNERGYFLDFEQWKCVTGFDEEGSKKAMDVAFDGMLTITMESPLPTIPFRYEQIDKDYCGAALPDRPVPGPFQNLAEGGNEIQLLPDNPWLVEYLKTRGVMD